MKPALHVFFYLEPTELSKWTKMPCMYVNISSLLSFAFTFHWQSCFWTSDLPNTLSSWLESCLTLYIIGHIFSLLKAEKEQSECRWGNAFRHAWTVASVCQASQDSCWMWPKTCIDDKIMLTCQKIKHTLC